MNTSLQEILFYIPLYQLTLLTPLPKQPVYYQAITDTIPTERLQLPTLLAITSSHELNKISDKEVAVQLIQDPNLKGIIICMVHNDPIGEGALPIFRECKLMVIHIENPIALHLFYQDKLPLSNYSQLSIELNGFIAKGFTNIAAELATNLETPLLYIDENDQILWQAGKEDALLKANNWLRKNRNKQKVNGNSSFVEHAKTNSNNPQDPYKKYIINIAGIYQQALVVSTDLDDWQIRLIDKLAGLTALLLQTEEMFQEQQRNFKEHFVYDLLFHKFESKKVMIKQGKTWGWNLEKPHHLMIIHIDPSKQPMTNVNWMDEIIHYLETQLLNLPEKLFVFPFQDQIVVLIEDDTNRSIGDRKNYVIEIANFLNNRLANIWPMYRFFIGIGKWYQDSVFLNKSYQEAELALQFGKMWFENKTLYHINDLGIIRLLINIHQEILVDFSEDYLSLLTKYDDEQGTLYIETLKAYIQHQGIISEIADVLFVHPNTLRNRLKKIEELTGVNIQDPEEFMNLAIAVKIHSIKGLK